MARPQFLEQRAASPVLSPDHVLGLEPGVLLSRPVRARAEPTQREEDGHVLSDVEEQQDVAQ